MNAKVVMVLFGLMLTMLSACAPASKPPSSNDLRMVRQYRTINLEKTGQYGPYSISVPAFTAQEFVLTANPNRVEKYSILLRSSDGSVDVYVCAGRPCLGFASTADWKDLGAATAKGPEIRVNGTKSDYVYALNSTSSPKTFTLTATAK